MKCHTDALHRRWADPDYRARQTDVLRRAAAARKAAMATPLARALHGQAVKVGWRNRKKAR